MPSCSAASLRGSPDAYRCRISRSRRPSSALAKSRSASIAVAHSRLLSTSPRATVAAAVTTVRIEADFGMTPAAPAASASRTRSPRSAIECTSTGAPMACTLLTFWVTLEPSPSDRSSTTTSTSRPASPSMRSATLGAASMKSWPASTKAALRPIRTDSWSSTTAIRAGRACTSVSGRSITVLIPTPARVRRRSCYCCRRAASRAHERTHGLDVVGAREEVEGAQAGQGVAQLGEHPRIAGEGHRIARHVHELGGSRRGEGLEHGSPGTRARRVEHDGRARQAGALRRGRVGERAHPALDAGRDGLRAEPVGEVLGGVFGGALVGFHRGDAGARAEAVADGRREQPDAAVEVEVRRARIEERLVDRLLYRAREGARRRGVHLPEPGVVEAELALAD